MSWAHNSASAMVGALVLPEMRSGMADASAQRRPWMPLTRKSASHTDISSVPIRAFQRIYKATLREKIIALFTFSNPFLYKSDGSTSPSWSEATALSWSRRRRASQDCVLRH